MVIFRIFFFLLICSNAWAQRPLQFYAQVDSIALNTKYKGDLRTLTSTLVDSFPDEELKARAIFRWITEHIAYDYKLYNRLESSEKEERTFKCKTEKDCDAQKLVWEVKYLDGILKKKKAICGGYSLLFHKMCGLAGLKSEVVPGYTKTEAYQIGSMGRLKHAWNVVYIKGKYHLVDATWAAGIVTKGADDKLDGFQKEFNSYYWLTDPKELAKTHYPKDSNWVLIPGYKRIDFRDNPFIDFAVIQQLNVLSPSSGLIRAKKGDSVHFVIKYPGAVRNVQINTNLFKNPSLWITVEDEKGRTVKQFSESAKTRQQYIDFLRDDNLVKFSYHLPDPSLYYIDVLFNGERVLRFKVEWE